MTMEGMSTNRRQLLTRTIAGAALGAAVLAGGDEPAVAQQASPAATPGFSDYPGFEAAAAQVRYVHPEKVYDYLPGFQDEALIASLFELDVGTYRSIREQFADTAMMAAGELLEDIAFTGRVDQLPFQPGATVVGIGESDMDDLQSSLEILRHLLHIRRPDDGIDILNLAISGQATSEAVGRFSAILLQHEPDWVLCGLGGNDTLRNGREATKTRVSIEETQLNLTELHHLATTRSSTEWVWLTRWAIDSERIAANPVFQEQGISIRNDDWSAINAFVRQQEGRVVDLEPLFGQPPAPEFLEPDGLHPTLAGQKEIARVLVESLMAKA